MCIIFKNNSTLIQSRNETWTFEQNKSHSYATWNILSVRPWYFFDSPRNDDTNTNVEWPFKDDDTKDQEPSVPWPFEDVSEDSELGE